MYRNFLHWLAVTSLPEDFRRHVAWCSTSCCQHVELLLVHNPRQSKISDQQIGVIFWRSKKKVFWFQVTMDNAVIVQIGDSGEGGSDEVTGVGFVVVAFPTDAIE